MKKIFFLILISFLTISNLFGSTNNDDLAYKIEKMRSHGIVKDRSEFEFDKDDI